MLNETFLLLSPNELKDIFLTQFNILHLAIVYVLMYVLYKTIGRYIYFKPHEHTSKINRTFLSLSLFVITIHYINKISDFLPILTEYRWLFIICILIIIIAPLSIIIDRIIWSYEGGRKSKRGWLNDYVPISKDYYKTSVTKTESRQGGTYSWEEEAVQSTRSNIHSDALINLLAGISFFITGLKWSYESSMTYGWQTYLIFSVLICTTVCIFLNEAVFSWIDFTADEIRRWNARRKKAKE